MQWKKIVIILLVSLCLGQSSFAKKLSPDKNSTNDIIQLIEEKMKDKRFLATINAAMEMLNSVEEAIIHFEGMIKVIEDTSLRRTSAYLDNPSVINTMDEFRKFVDEIASQKNVEAEELFKWLSDNYRKKLELLFYEEIQRYFDLAEIFDDNFDTRKNSRGNGANKTHLKPILDKEAIYQFSVLALRNDVKDPFELETQLREAFDGGNTNHDKIFKAYVLCLIYNDRIAKQQGDDTERISIPQCKAIEGETQAILHLLRASMSMKSLALVMTDYSMCMDKLTEAINAGKVVLLKNMKSEIADFRKRYEKSEGLEKELLFDQLSWKKKDMKSLEIEMRSKEKISNVEEYNRFYTKLRDTKKVLRDRLFSIYYNAKELTARDNEIDRDVMNNTNDILNVLFGYLNYSSDQNQ